MGARMRELDWSATPLGPVEGWPQSLRSALSICLNSRFPIAIYWGPEYVLLYNDAWRPIVGNKHPGSLGRTAREVWPEIWDIIGPMLGGLSATGEATWRDEQLLPMHRYGYTEECYFDYTFSPIRGQGAEVEGVFNVVTETTYRVLNDRRNRLLRELGTRTALAKSAGEVCRVAAEVIAAAPYDLPFALLYLIDADAHRAWLAGAAGLRPGDAAAPEEIMLGPGSPEGPVSGWPVGRVAETNEAERVDLAGLAVPGGPWPEPPREALALPVATSGQGGAAGVLIAGVSARRVLDDNYRDFFDRAAGHVGASIANARAYEEERRRAEALAEIDRAKTTFFSNVSHEFRTPLTLMLGPLEDLLARQERIHPEDRELLAIVRRNGQRLLKLVNTLLEFSRIEAGRVQAIYEPVDLAAYTAELASVFRAAVERAGMRLAIDCPPLPEPVYVDRDMWEKIVLNLVSNAFKYTLAGEIRVSLRAVERTVTLAVQDTGSGIPESELPNVFNRFHRVQGTKGRTHEGTGIGLALVQELVRQHGGTVSADSVYGEGSTFTVTLPFGREHLPADRIGGARALTSTAVGASPFVEEALRWLPGPRIEDTGTFAIVAPPRPAHPEQERSRVLLADDNADMRDYVRRLLATEYEVTAVTDGRHALRAAREQRPDLVLTDVMMPGLDGFGLLKALREDPATAAIPVIMLSARAGEEARVEGLEAGADDYLFKPFSARELLARVSGALALSRVRREALNREEELTLELQEESRRKDEFLATLAHELRNPLAPIRNGLQILRLAGDRPEAAEKARAMIERQVRQMVRLIDDLLDLSRISRGKVELRRERVDLAAVVNSAVEISRPPIEESGHRLDLRLTAEPLLVDGDVTRLAQVIANLLNNAAKYTQRGGHIELEVRREGEAARISVRDNGVGIPSAMLPRVFEMFTQVDRSLERAQGGLGIGLSIVKRLVEMHGGTVEARSGGHGQGSEFVVRLPVLEPAAEAAGGPEATEGSGVMARRRILVADDNEDSAASLAMMLSLMGNEVQTAHDGVEAVEAAAAFRPDAILLDIGMPRMNGYDACRAIREQPWGKDVVLLALTGWGQEEDKRKSREAGFDDHLVKPVEPATLERKLADAHRETGGPGAILPS